MGRKKTQTKAPETRGPRGGGSVFPDARRGGWRAKAIVGRDPQTKRAKYKWVHADTHAEAVRLKREAETKSPQRAPQQTTLEQWAPVWLASLGKKPQTIDDYRRLMNDKILPVLGAKRLVEITTFDVEAATREWEKQLGAASVRKVLGVLSAAFSGAERKELVLKNPVRKAPKPQLPKQQFDLFAPAEVKRIVTAATADPRLYCIAVCAAMGTRIGEATALGPKAYDPKTCLLSVTQTRTVRHGWASAKSRNSVRDIKAPAAVRACLAAGVPSVHYSVARRRFESLLKSLDIRDRGLHQLRHTLATHWLAANVPITDIAAYLGDLPEVVMRTYCHPTGADPSEVTDRLLGGGKVAPAGKKAKKPVRKRDLP